MRKKFFILLLSIIFFFSINTTKTYANNNQKVYISEVVKNILDYYNEDYYIESSSNYYFYVKPYIHNQITSSTQLIEGDMDSIIFVVKTLEDYAKIYDSTASARDVTNLVLGYFRHVAGYDSINFKFTSGFIDINFVNYINSHASLEWLRDFINHNPNINDPLNPDYTKLNKIDIKHMMATIDGTYAFTEQVFILDFNIPIRNNFQRDLSGWAGDLQSFVRHNLYKQSIPQSNLKYYTMPTASNDPIDFGNYLGFSHSNFSNSDMLADIDGMTIAKYFLDTGNSLSVALNAYYNFVYNDNTLKYNRYRVFVLSSTEETMYRYGSVVTDFKNEVYYSMGIFNDDWFGLQDWPFLTFNGNFEFAILNSDYLSKDDEFSVPDWAYRLYGAQHFMNYILDMASPPKDSGGGGGGKPPFTELPDIPIGPFTFIESTYQELNDWCGEIIKHD